ncbi:hypothetical protein GL218_04550 [Daldinia childiae]|uniref:uncharacterized protein n=1 Tax=Daldinia childiae TaxID=326645 RepID=UPI0014472F51|nr:uncharacterized protein GL218_04550 [Daldinia childiae]KAF3059918.1 hypothetical protein GL218_04550 [Daldinia childiae]
MATQSTSVAESRQEEEINIVCGEPTGKAENGEESRRDSHCFPPEKETYIQKNKKTKRIDGWRQTHHTAYAVRNATHIYKLSRDSPHSATYESLTNRQERIDFLKRHGIIQRR